MPHGKTIQIFFSGGTVAGIKHAQVLNWTGQAIQCPRVAANELNQWPESERPGVYLLLGEDKESGDPTVYIGESENVRLRITQQENDKEWWNEVILFSSKDDNLTKAHIKYLESKCFGLAKTAGRYHVDNSTCPTESALPRADRHAMEEFIDHLRLVVGALGHRVFESVAPRMTAQVVKPATTAIFNPSSQNIQGSLSIDIKDGEDRSARLEDVAVPAPDSDRSTEFSFSPKGAHARGMPIDEGFVVLAGSTAAPDMADSCPEAAKHRREHLKAIGTLIDEVLSLRFSKDVSFGSPSAAACVVSGNSRNGLIEWKDANGRTLKDYYSSA